MDIISHNTLLFNIHDLVLLMSAALYLFLAITFAFLAYQHSNKTYLFGAIILFLLVAQSVNTLMIWSGPVRLLILNWNPNLIFWGGLGFWLQGPLLFLLVSSVIEPNFKLNRMSSLHLLPAIFVGILLVVNYHFLPEKTQVENMSQLRFLHSGLMENILTARYMSIIVYGGLSLGALSYKQNSQSGQPAHKSQLYSWLKLAVICSIIMGAWPLLVHLTSNRIPLSTSNMMGLATNYLSLFFSVTFMLFTLKYCHFYCPKKADGIENAEEILSPQGVTETVSQIKPELIKYLEEHMIYEKPFLIHNINLEMLANRLSMPERTLSRTINQHFKQNFVEFINSYRIVEAKKLLNGDVNNQKSILTIMDEAGFNSKSTFNSTFKHQVGMTPSQFKKENL